MSVKMIEGPDGYARSQDEEARLNIMAVEVLGDAAGRDFMTYLESITIRRASGPNIDDAALRHLEGMRFLVHVLSKRVQLGHKEKANAGSKK